MLVRSAARMAFAVPQPLAVALGRAAPPAPASAIPTDEEEYAISSYVEHIRLVATMLEIPPALVAQWIAYSRRITAATGSVHLLCCNWSFSHTTSECMSR